MEKDKTFLSFILFMIIYVAIDVFAGWQFAMGLFLVWILSEVVH